MSINVIWRSIFARHAQRKALTVNQQQWTYAELDRVTDTLAARLQSCGVRPGDRVAYLLPNGAELVFINLACLKIGAIAVPLNVRLVAPEFAYILDHCQAQICIAHAELFSALEPALVDISSVQKYFIVGTDIPFAGTELFERLLSNPANRIEQAHITPDTAAAILYTSGTTARPKGVTHTHGSLSNTVQHYTQAVGMTQLDVVLGMLSMSHVFGFTQQLLSPLSVGAHVVIAPSLEPDRVFDLIESHRVTHLYGLPVMFAALTRHQPARRANMVSLRYCLAGGDAVSPALSANMKSILGLDLHEGCGMTEVIPYTLNRLGAENRIGTIGRASVGMQLRIVNECGEDVQNGEAGEILVKSDALMRGYWNDPDATNAVMRDGWFYTGDVGRRDDDGYYSFVGRRKEIIVRGGSNISPLEVEAVLSLHPAVREVAVVGAPDPTLGEIVVAFVAKTTDSEVTDAELKHFAMEKIAPYKVPERIGFVSDLPRGLTGKVHRKTLKEWAAAQSVDEHPE